jgi:hypothetical protein
MSLWTASLLLLPINLKSGAIEPIWRLGLPTTVGQNRTHQLDVVGLWRLNQQRGINIAGIEQMFFGSQAFILEGLMNHWGHGTIRGGGARRFNLGNQVGGIGITTFRQVNFVAGSLGLAFATEARLYLIG